MAEALAAHSPAHQMRQQLCSARAGQCKACLWLMLVPHLTLCWCVGSQACHTTDAIVMGVDPVPSWFASRCAGMWLLADVAAAHGHAELLQPSMAVARLKSTSKNAKPVSACRQCGSTMPVSSKPLSGPSSAVSPPV